MRLKSLLVLMLMASYVSASTIVELNLKVDNNGFTRVEERIVFESNPNGIIILPDDVDELNLTDEQGNVEYSKIYLNSLPAINITTPGYFDNAKSREVWLRYGTTSLTRKDKDEWSLHLIAPANPRKTIVKVSLPEGSNVTTLMPYELLRTIVADGVWIYPQDADVGSDNRFNLSLSYNFIKGYKPTAKTSTTTLVGAQVTQTEKSSNYLLYAMFAVAAAAVGYIVYSKGLSRRVGDALTVNVAQEQMAEPNVVGGQVSYGMDSTQGSSGKKAVKESILNMLDDYELSIVKLLESSEEDEVTQAYIHKTTGIPKSSLSDIIRHIEKRNIIERRTEGRVKWIKLKSWVLE